MTAYDAGSAFLEIVPSFRGFDALIDAQVKKLGDKFRDAIAQALPAGFVAGSRTAGAQGARAGSDFGGSFARSVKTRIEAALRDLPKVEITANSSDADLKLAGIRAQLETLSKQRIGVDIDEGRALAQIAFLQSELKKLGASTDSARVKVDTAEAAAKLGEIKAQLDALKDKSVLVRVNEIGGGGGGFGLGSLGLLASPAAIPVAAAGVGGLAGIGGLVASGVAGLGVLGLAFKGVGGAVTAVGQASTASGAAGVNAAQGVAAAVNGVRLAQEGLANAEASASDGAISAAEQVKGALSAQIAAEQGLTAAQAGQKTAQEALTAARVTAAQTLQDLKNQVRDGQLSAQQDALNVTKAQVNLQAVDANPLSTVQQRQQAALDVQTAMQAQREQVVTQQRLVETQAAAAKAGVNGSTVVLQAQKQLAAANQTVADSYAAIRAAVQSTGDAQRAEAAQARQSALSIAQARASVVSAQVSVQTASAGGSSGVKAQDQVAALSPPLRDFATFIDSVLKPKLAGLQRLAQAGVLPGVEQGLKALLPVLPGVEKLVGSLGKTLGGLFASAGKGLAGPGFSKFFDYLQATAGPTITTFANVIGNVAHGFAGLLVAFAPISKQVGDGILALSQRFADFGTHASSSKGFQGFLKYVQDEGPKVVTAVGRIAEVGAKLIKALAPIGGKILDGLSGFAGIVDHLSGGAFDAIAGGVLAVYGSVKLLSGAITLVKFATEAWTAVTKIAGIVQAAFDAVLDANPIALIVIGIAALAAGLIYAYKHSETFRKIVQEALSAVKAVAVDIFDFFKDHWKLILALITGPIGLAALFVIDHFSGIKKAVVGVFHDISDAVKTVKNDIVKTFNDVVGFFEGLPARISRGSSRIFDGLKSAFKDVINFLIRGLDNLHFTIPSINTHIPGVGTIGGFDFGVPHIPPLRAGGGPVSSGMPYIVGEHEPEVFVPSQAGQILNQQQLAGFLASFTDSRASSAASRHQLADVGANGRRPWTIGEYHQHFHPPIAEPIAGYASKANRRLMQTLNS